MSERGEMHGAGPENSGQDLGLDLKKKKGSRKKLEARSSAEILEMIDEATLEYGHAAGNKEINKIKKEIKKLKEALLEAKKREGGDDHKTEIVIEKDETVPEIAEENVIGAVDENKNKTGIKTESEFWVESRSDWQKDIVDKSREAVVAAKKLRNQESKVNTVSEIESEAETAVISEAASVVVPEKSPLVESNETLIKTLEEKKADSEKYLETLNSVFEESKKSDPNFSKGMDRDVSLDDPKETKRRMNIGRKMTETREKISQIKAEIARLSGKGAVDAEKDATVQHDIKPAGRKKLVAVHGSKYELVEDERVATDKDFEEIRKGWQEKAKQAVEAEQGVLGVTAVSADTGKNEVGEKYKPKTYPDRFKNRITELNKIKGQAEWEKLIAKNKAEKLEKKNTVAMSAGSGMKPVQSGKKENNLSENNSLILNNMEKNNEGAAKENIQEPKKDISGAEKTIDGSKDNNKKKERQEQEGVEILTNNLVVSEAEKNKIISAENSIAEGFRSNTVKSDVDSADAGKDKVESELRKQLREKREKFEKLPEEAKEMIRDEMMNTEMVRMGEKNSADELEDKLALETQKNAEMKEAVERAKEVEAILAEMQAELDRQTEEVEAKNPMLKKAINFFKKPKVLGAIIFGLAGAGAYATGGVGVPVYFAVKAALAKAGISIFVPAAVGHGLSTWGTAAAGGGFLGYLGEKLGLAKGEKSDKEKHKEGLENLKNIGQKEQNKEDLGEYKIMNWLDQKGDFDIGAITKLVQEKDKELMGALEEDPELMNNVVKAFKKKLSIFQFSDKQKNINNTYFWLVKEQKRLEMKREIAKELAAQDLASSAAKAGAESVSARSKTSGGSSEEIPAGEINKMTFQEIAKKRNVDTVGEAPAEKIAGKTDKEPEQMPSTSENVISPEDRKKMIDAAHLKKRELADVIRTNKEKINTNIFENLSDLLDNKITEGKYEIVAPMVDLVKNMVEANKKAKFSFLDKENVPGDHDQKYKDKLVNEIKKHVFSMKSEGRLGATNDEKEKKQAAIESFLDSREFRDRL